MRLSSIAPRPGGRSGPGPLHPPTDRRLSRMAVVLGCLLDLGDRGRPHDRLLVTPPGLRSDSPSPAIVRCRGCFPRQCHRHRAGDTRQYHDTLDGALSLAALAWVSYAAAAGWPAQLHNADSLIPVFVSLEGWSLFFWGQDRFGMLLPLLALPIRDGFWNLVVHRTCWGRRCSFAGIVASLIRCGASVPSVRALAGTRPPARVAGL